MLKLLVTFSIGIICIGFIGFYVKKTSKTGYQKTTQTIYEFELTTIDNKPMPLNQFRGNVVLIVNTASLCGFTKQYKGLQDLHNRYSSMGLIIIAVPSNDFGNQEPSSNNAIKSFCHINFGASFPIATKTIVKGAGIHPLYEFLTDKTRHPDTGGAINWNFNKFLVDKNGHVVKRYASFKRPLSDAIIRDIEYYLNLEGSLTIDG